MDTDLLMEAYSADNFKRLGYQLIDQLADYLHQCQQGGEGLPAIHWRSPASAKAEWGRVIQETGKDPSVIFHKTLQEGVHLLHPKYMGHQISPPLPLTALAGLLGDWMNNGMGVFEMGIPGTSMEAVVIREVARAFGFPEEADGFFTSGGTLANTTALLTARSIKARQKVWTDGHQPGLALMVSEAAHYCVDRAVRIMGWGAAGLIKIPVDEQYRMRTDLLEAALAEARTKGKQIIAVVGSACSTATGSFDDLRAIGQFCRQHQLWFHVDGAHGAALAFSADHRQVLDGLEMADSVAMDFHKMLLTPSITTALVFREGQDSYRTFRQRADYLFEQADAEWFNLAKRTFECTKLMIGFKAYITLAQYGTRVWEQAVTRMVDLGKELAALIKARPGFELAVEPACNIVCFRYRPPALNDPGDISQLNDQIRQALLEDGEFYLVKTLLKEGLWLRTTLANPFTDTPILEALLDKIEELAEGGKGE